MKNILTILSFVILSVLTSCEKDRTIDMEQFLEVSFNQKGGSVTVQTKDKRYYDWWINNIYDSDSDTHYLVASDRDHNKILGNGITAEVTSPNSVVITVEPSKETHHWTITMEAMDMFSYIAVKQE